MNAIELLKADHDKVEGLFQKVKANEDADHTQLFEKIKEELEVHTHIEEKIFYPTLLEKGDEELQKIVKEGIEEHHQVKIFLREISSLTDSSEKFDPKLAVLMEDVQHHVKEEEDEMFSMVKKQLDGSQLEELGAALEAEKAAYKKQSTASAAGK